MIKQIAKYVIDPENYKSKSQMLFTIVVSGTSIFVFGFAIAYLIKLIIS